MKMSRSTYCKCLTAASLRNISTSRIYRDDDTKVRKEKTTPESCASAYIKERFRVLRAIVKRCFVLCDINDERIMREPSKSL
jgi:hypothetical protein